MKKKYFLILLIGLLSMTIGCQRGEEPTVEKEAAPSIIIDKAISADGVAIAYEARGEGEPVLFFVHEYKSFSPLLSVPGEDHSSHRCCAGE